MYPRDPIMSSSPPRPTYHNAPSDSPDELAEPFVTQATLPWNPTGRAAHVALPTQTQTTQPTQLLNTPHKPRTHVQVARSSPSMARYSSPPVYSQSQRMSMAPPGTYTLLPQPVAKPVVDLTSDDPPVDFDSEEEGLSGSNLRPSNLEMLSTSTMRVEETPEKPSFGSNISSFAYNPNQNGKRTASHFTSPPQDKRPRPAPRQSGPSRALPVHADLDPQDIPSYDHRKKVVRLKHLFPGYTHQKLYDILVALHGDYSAVIRQIEQAEHKRLQPPVRQSGPSRALPVHADLDIYDIESLDQRRKVQRLKAIFPRYTIQDLYELVLSRNGDYEAAKMQIEQEEDNEEDELLRSEFFSSPKAAIPEPVYQPKKTTQRGLKAPIESIQQKFSTRQAQPASVNLISPEKPKKKRLIRGSDRPVEANPFKTIPGVPSKAIPKPITISSDAEEDEDEGIKLDSDGESEGDFESEVELDENKLLEFFNTCTVKDMVDLSSQKEADVRKILDQRPFKSLAQIEGLHTTPATTKTGKPVKRPRTTFGTKLVESASSMWSGFGAVDELVKECKERGKPIAEAMGTWGVNVFGENKDGELEIVNIMESPNHDSAIGTPSGAGSPRSNDGDDVGAAQLRKKMNNKKTKLLKKPSIMSDEIELKDYQIVGLNWLNLLWDNGVSGILADDMGLGKTCQVISFLSHLYETDAPGPHLIVVPGSTLENWLREFEFFAPELKKHVEPYYGGQADRAEQQHVIESNLDDIYVIVTTYDLAYKPDDNKFLRRCKPKACIFDEGHVLRNSDTQRYKSLMRINCDFRLLLTGTPLQNSLRELASILAFIMPDIFEKVKEDLEAIFKHKAKVKDADSHEALLSAQRIERARSMMTPFVLRRKKAQVLKHMPKKTCRVEYCELTESQQRLYSAQMEKQKQVLLDRAAGKPAKEHANVMMKLRQAAIHPLLFRDHYNDAKIKKMSKACIKEEMFMNSDPDIIFEELQLYQDYQCHSLALKYPKSLSKFALKHEEWMDSGKVKKLVELLKEYKKNGDRALIFSQFTSVMDILQWVLDTVDIQYSRLDGQTPIVERQALLDQFYEDESITVFMLSTKSGGAGINLACANKVIIFDSSFNPQDDIQAENRAHRVGQTRDVEVVRLVTKGTVEEQIHALGQSKLELDKMVSGEEGEAKGEKISAADEQGIEAVEKMMLEQLKNEKENGGDVKDEFLNGLKKAGLDMSAA